MYWPSPEDTVECVEETVVRARPVSSQRCSVPMNLPTFITEDSLVYIEQNPCPSAFTKYETRRFSVGCPSEAIELTSSYPAFASALRHQGNSRNHHEAPR